MEIKLYPRAALEKLWLEDQRSCVPDSETPPVCLRCGKPMAQRLVLNAMSRHADVYICKECGADEALRDAIGEPLPLRDWAAVTSGRARQVSLDGPVLTPVCTFGSIFKGTKKMFPLSNVEHPVSEVAYSRSYYNGHEWYRTWFHSSEERLGPPLSEEIDGFSNTLLDMPEFRSLDAMGRMCRSCAEHTNSTTDFNLYSETEHFYIWLQLITRERDYNLYVHFYLKSQTV